MAGLLLILALLAGFAGMLVVRLLPLGWLGLVVLTGMGGALAMLALMAASRWRARRLEGDYRRSPPDVLRGQSWTYRFYFLSGNLLPAFAFTMAVGVILLLAGPRDLAAAFLGAVAGAGTVAFLGALQGSLPASRTLRATLALCWRRMPRDVALASNQRDRGRPGGLAYLASLCWQLWRFLSSSLLLATRYRSVADEDLRSADPALPGLTRVLDRQRSGGGGRAPKLVPSGWVEPLRDTARRTFALALVTLLMLPLMWLATGLLPPPG
ncbi:MAG TPA: hypothetical protein VLV83_22535, partial [Acidobacteriota bacterium]|nr:hypothetical protein [Acidobacteriota bacterium]